MPLCPTPIAAGRISTFAWFVADATVNAIAGTQPSTLVAQVDDGITVGDTITINVAFAAVTEDSLPTYNGTSGKFDDVALTTTAGVNLGYYEGGTVPGNSSQKKHGVAKAVVTLSKTNANISMEQAIKGLAADAVYTLTISTPEKSNPANHARVHKSAPTVTAGGYSATEGGVQATITLNHSTGAWSIAAVSSSTVVNTNDEKSLKFYYSIENASDTTEDTDDHANDTIKAGLAA